MAEKWALAAKEIKGAKQNATKLRGFSIAKATT